jgi:hypothetical protein
MIQKLKKIKFKKGKIQDLLQAKGEKEKTKKVIKLLIE